MIATAAPPSPLLRRSQTRPMHTFLVPQILSVPNEPNPISEHPRDAERAPRSPQTAASAPSPLPFPPASPPNSHPQSTAILNPISDPADHATTPARNSSNTPSHTLFRLSQTHAKLLYCLDLPSRRRWR